ncbi:MAG: aminotransferase class V-fold PLP-dependent enzyme [Spirochaetales bacterium]|nr:aminotransferase class V-fold PLP-dependent enzyme [Spirochaetales bacterium]
MSVNNYFDNGATSFPKPPEVAEEISRYLNELGGPYGRSFYGRALEVSRVVEETRDLVASQLGISDGGKIVFTANATQGINTVIKGFVDRSAPCEVWISKLEHNAVTRPLYQLEQQKKINIKYLPSLSDGKIDIKELARTDLSGADLIVLCHQSNVNGLVQPVEKIRAAIGKTPILLDCAQSAGHITIKAEEWDVDYLAFTGHKGLLGPTGTGGLYIKDNVELQPLINGGTGSRSESWETPDFMPDRFEAGTPNIAGIFGLYGALNNYPEPRHGREDFITLLNSISELPGIKVHRARDIEDQGELFSITSSFADPSAFGMALYDAWGIETRLGLHCAPLAHKTIKTFPEGTIRIAPSPYHGLEDFEHLKKALTSISEDFLRKNSSKTTAKVPEKQTDQGTL